MNEYLDYWNLMAYDYAGSWDTTSGHQANLYPDPANNASTPFSTLRAVTDYIAAGIPASKIILGMPIYGRSFESTSGLGEPYSGIGTGTWEAGVWDYKVLPKSGATEYYDDIAGASYSYDSSTQELISYDTVGSVQKKTTWLLKEGLGGAMFWEASADRNGTGSLIGTVAAQLGTLDQTENCLTYPDSKYANIAAGVPNE